jgi:broad specificity phosphatase PhoE
VGASGSAEGHGGGARYHRPAIQGAEPCASASDTLVIVVRHAEKAVEPGADPALSEAGRARAERLAAVLADARITAAYSTQFKRTRDTATPAAKARGIAIRVHEAHAGQADADAAALAAEIRAEHAGGTVLVVAHSNTVPAIVKALGGVEVAAIADDEYDRLYVVALGETPRVVSATYGD